MAHMSAADTAGTLPQDKTEKMVMAVKLAYDQKVARVVSKTSFALRTGTNKPTPHADCHAWNGLQDLGWDTQLMLDVQHVLMSACNICNCPPDCISTCLIRQHNPAGVHLT